VPLGCLPDPQYVEESVTLDPGATLLLYTDGLTERRGEDMDASLERLRVTMAENARENLPLLLDHAVTGAGRVAPADDVALVALRFTGDRTAQRLTYAAELVQVPAARHDLRDWLTARGIGGLPAADILLAAGEAMANAVEHSGTEQVELEFAAPYPDVVRIVVRDQGAWKDPVVNPHRGRGFGLMRSLMDECTVVRDPHGTVVRLVRRLTPEVVIDDTIGADAVPDACTVSLEPEGIAVLAGDLDISCADSVHQALTASADLRVVDLSAVTHLDSSGARMLFELPTRPDFIAPPGTPPRRTLDLSALSDVMVVRDA
jgi:anti-sigma regulatory factor (Ser/Thr protein kinase)